MWHVLPPLIVVYQVPRWLIHLVTGCEAEYHYILTGMCTFDLRSDITLKCQKAAQSPYVLGRCSLLMHQQCVPVIYLLHLKCIVWGKLDNNPVCRHVVELNNQLSLLCQSVKKKHFLHVTVTMQIFGFTSYHDKKHPVNNGVALLASHCGLHRFKRFLARLPGGPGQGRIYMT